MAYYRPGHAIALAGHGFDADGPHLILNDVYAASQERFSVLGRTFTMRRLKRRRCTGRFDLLTHKRDVCPLGVELLPDSKEAQCPACIEATGFNPSFYHASHVSPQQRTYNAMPHFVYLAYFSPDHVKAGISSELRGIGRLLDQGARAARVVGRFESAIDARALEEALCAQDGVRETMRASLKARLLSETRYDPTEAERVLDAACDRLAGIATVAEAGFAPEKVRDLSPFYFEESSPDINDMQLLNGRNEECGGRCVGMVGATLLFEQEGTVFLTPIKEWESHEVELFDGEAVCIYDLEPQQFSLF